MKNFLTAVAVAAGLGLATASARAQESTGPIGPGAPVPGTPEVQPQAQQLSLEQLGRMLQQLGYNPKAALDKNGKQTGYNLGFASNGWTMRLYVALSSNGQYIWIDASVGRVVDLAGPAGGPLKLLGEHDRLWPAYACFYPKDGRLLLVMPIKNNGVTSAVLKQQVDSFSAKVRQVITLWKSTQAAPAPAPQPAPLP